MQFAFQLITLPIILSIILSAMSFTHLTAAWRQLEGPSGGVVTSLAVGTFGLYCVADGKLHQNFSGTWSPALSKPGQVELNNVYLLAWRGDLYRLESVAGFEFRLMLYQATTQDWVAADLPNLTDYKPTQGQMPTVHVTSERMYVGVNHQVYFSEDGQNWSLFAELNPLDGTINRLMGNRLMGVDEGLLVRQQGQLVLKQIDSKGELLNDITLPTGSSEFSHLYVLGQSILAQNRQDGVFQTLDGGETWEEVNAGLPKNSEGQYP